MSSNALEKLRRRSAAVRIQSNIRRRQHHRWTVQLAYNTWEKLIDHKQSAFFYYNHTSVGLIYFLDPKTQLTLTRTNIKFIFFFCFIVQFFYRQLDKTVNQHDSRPTVSPSTGCYAMVQTSFAKKEIIRT